MDYLDDAEKAAVSKALRSETFQNLIGAEEWDLSDWDEANLWSTISRLA